MKVLYVSALYPKEKLPQYGIFVKEQIDSLCRMGVSAVIAVPVSIQEYDNIKEKIVIQNRKKIIYFPFDSILPGACNLWISCISLEKALIKWCKKEIHECDLIHAHETLCAGDACRRIAQKYHKPYVVTVHGLDVEFKLNTRFNILNYMNRKMCKKVYKYADAVIGVSNKVTTNVSGLYTCAKTKVVYNGYNSELFYKKHPAVEHKFRIICACNFISLKRVCDLITACGMLKERGFIFETELYGRGPLKEELQNQINELNLEDIMIFKGYITSDNLAVAYQNADVFVMPSEYEALGCVYLEAMACGLPVIACENQGIAELIVNGVNSYLVPPRKPEAIADILEELMNDTEKYNCISKSALDSVKKMTWDQSAQQLEQIYKGILNG